MAQSYPHKTPASQLVCKALLSLHGPKCCILPITAFSSAASTVLLQWGQISLGKECSQGVQWGRSWWQWCQPYPKFLMCSWQIPQSYASKRSESSPIENNRIAKEVSIFICLCLLDSLVPRNDTGWRRCVLCSPGLVQKS